jgi:hypothetical protein
MHMDGSSLCGLADVFSPPLRTRQRSWQIMPTPQPFGCYL